MSDSGGTDNPAFNNSDEYNATSTNLENNQTENLQQEQKEKSLPVSNGHSFVSKHYVEPSQNTPEAQYKTETRIEVPTEENKTSNTIKTNGINGNGNNNDLSFLNSSITSGQINDGKKEQIEAVNLELVSMRPYTGNNLQTKGQEACEIPSDPYEEYFVPVNEHRKYIRGEKLYVTKDKRSKGSYWRRIACWGFGLSVLAVALIIAILAGTGVILTQEATQPLDNEHQRSLDDVNAAGSQEFIKNPPSSPSPETSTFPPWRTTDETMLKTVPNALEGSIWLDNLVWNDDLMDVKARVYRDVASEIEDNLSNMIDTEETRTMIKIYNITKHGQVLFRIGNPPVLQPELLQGKLEKMLRQNGNMIGKYHLSRMHVKNLIDECQYENLNCSELCQFDYVKSIFACNCLPGKMLDATGVNCIDESDLSNIDMVTEKPKPSGKEMIQGRGRAPEQSFEPEGDHDHWMHHHYHYDNEQSFTDSSVDKNDETSLKTMLTMNEEPKYELNSSSEPNDEPMSPQEEVSQTIVKPTTKSEMTPSFELNIESESTFKPNLEDSTPKVEMSSNVDPIPEGIPTMIPTPEPTTEMEMNVKQEMATEMTLKSTVEPKLMSESVTERMEFNPELETTVSSTATVKLESEAKSKISSENESYPEPTVESHTEQMSNSEDPMNINSQMKFDQESITVYPTSVTSPPMLSSEVTTESESTIKLMTELTLQSSSEITPTDPRVETNSEPTLISVMEPEPSLKPAITIGSEEISDMIPRFEPIEPENISEDPKSMIESNMSTKEMEYHPELHSEIDPSIPTATKTTIMSSTVTENILKTTPISDTADVTTFVPDEIKTTSESTIEFNPEFKIQQDFIKKSDTVTQFNTTEMDEKVKPIFDGVTQSELMMNADFSTTYEPIEKDSEPVFNFMPEVKPEISTLEPFTVSDVEPETTEKLQLSTEMTVEVTKDMKSNPEVTQSLSESHTMDIMNTTEANSEFPLQPLPVIPLGIKPDSEKHVDDLTNMTETFTTMMPDTAGATTSYDNMNDSINFDDTKDRTVMPDSDYLHSVDVMNTTHVIETTEEIIQDNEHSIKPEINSSQSFMNNDSNIPPELIPEKIDPYVLIRNAFKTATESVESTTVSVMHELESSSENTNEKLPDIPTAFEEKHFESMSPFLPEIIREKETKKAPRLDKDEQDFPNPFEPHVEDVIIHHQITMTPPADVNGTEFTDVANKSHLSHDAYQTETSHQESMGMTETTTVTNSPLLITQTDFAVTMLPEMNEEKIETSSTDNTVIHATDKNMSSMDVEVNNDVVMNNTNNESMEQIKNISRIETTTYMDEQMLKTTTARMMMSTETEPSPVTLINDDDSQLQNKDEDNALEDQYNDIIEERISKKIDDTSDLRKKNYLINKLNVKSTTFKNIKTTPPMEMSESTTLIEDNMSTEKTTISEMTTVRSKDDNKLTTEVPIMPEEIQQDISTTEVVEKTESSMINQSVSMVVDSPKTIFFMSMLEAKTTAQIPILPGELTTEMSTTQKMSNESEVVTTQAMETSTASFESIKPVSEVIIDDAEPEIFGHTHFFRTTESVPLEKDEFENIPEDKLKIIPLDDDKTINTTITTITTPADNLTMNVTETPSTMQTIFILNDMPAKPKENTFTIPKLKITEITSASQQPPIAQNNNQSMNATAKIHSGPDIIPVYENIEDDVENPMVKPLQPINDIFQLSNSTMNQNTEEKNMTESTLKTMTVTSPMPPNDNYQMFSKCTAGQFQCINGTSRDGAYCVSLSSKCDSENDCSDASDEINCEIEGCPGNFQCKSGQCLGRHLVCNGIADCDDGSDENNCQDWTCLFDEFKCPSGRCIPDLWRCNGRPDCEDHRDEYSCSKSCNNDEYLCPSENWCVPQTWRCNGIEECINGEDEKLCDCGLEQFKCETGGCITLQQVCDGINHCPDHSDEWDCLMMNMTSTTDTTGNDSDTHMPVGQPVLLKIKHNDGDRHLVCSDNWTKNHSDIYCQSLGYFGSEAFESMKYEEKKQILRLKDNYETTLNLVGNLELSNRCESNEFVKISCQEFNCGSSENEGPTARLIGGTPAVDGQLSSVALLKETKSGVVCTASVLGPLHALASYSCIHKHRQSSNWEMLTGRELQKSVKVKNIIPYPQVKYNQFLYNDDITLIQLETPLILSRNLSALCLPNQQIQPRPLCVTAGWGFPTSGEVNLKLEFLPVLIFDTEECNATSHYAGFITKSNICAKFTGTDKGTCNNDEGAPLICASEPGQWELQGLLSHHSRCSRDHPAIYSSLTPVISWLQHSVPALQMRI